MFWEKVKNDQLGKTERLLAKSMLINQPLVRPDAISINVTARCNSRCIYCDAWEKPALDVSDPSVDDLRPICTAAQRMGVTTLILSGGEPLIRADLEAIIAAAGKRLQVVVITNGMLLSPKRIDSLINSGLKILTFSLDTFEADCYQKLRGVPYRFAEKTLETLVYAKQKYRDFWINLNCVISRYNIGGLEEYARQFFTRFPGLGGISFQTYDSAWKRNPELAPLPEQRPVLIAEMKQLIALKKAGYSISNTEDYLNEIPDFFYNRRSCQKVPCSSGFTSICVATDLKLHPCYLFPAIADLRQEDLKQVWRSEKMKAQRAKMLKGECAGCSCMFHKPKGAKQS